ncbi:DnaA N-terminal domain-containing protein [Peribacillus sp. SCS-155]
MSKPSFETWLKNTKVHRLQRVIFTVTAPNEFARDLLQERFSTQIS